MSGTSGEKVRRISSRTGVQQRLLRLLEDLMRTSLIPASRLQSRKGGGSVACEEKAV
jgi:hypothetical protein